MDNIVQLKYPTDIEDDRFENRRVVFMALTGETFEERETYLRGITKSRSSYDGFYNANKSNDDIVSKFKKSAEQISKTVGVGGLSFNDFDKSIKDLKGKVKSFLGDLDRSELKCVITLPLPGSLSDSQSHSWEQDIYLEAIGTGIADVASLVGGGVGSRINAGIEKIKNEKNSFNKYSGVASNIMGVRKPTINPGFFQNYTSSGLRSFSFSFTFVPESQSEANDVMEIIKMFKAFSSPSTQLGGTMLLSPFKWYINVSNQKVNELISLKECVCTSVTVTYGDDKFDCFYDGMPKTIKMALSFSECSLQYAENYLGSFEETTNVGNAQTETQKIDAKQNAVDAALSGAIQ